jgi:hypothetical protein
MIRIIEMNSTTLEWEFKLHSTADTTYEKKEGINARAYLRESLHDFVHYNMYTIYKGVSGVRGTEVLPAIANIDKIKSFYKWMTTPSPTEFPTIYEVVKYLPAMQPHFAAIYSIEQLVGIKAEIDSLFEAKRVLEEYCN